MKKEKVAVRLKQLMAEQGLKQVDLINKCKPICDKYNKEYDLKIKITKSDLSQWLKGIYEPSQSKLTVLAEALNTTETWLMGYDSSVTLNNGNIYTNKDNKFPVDATTEKILYVSLENMGKVIENLHSIENKLNKEIWDLLDLDNVYSPNTEAEIDFGLNHFSNFLNLYDILVNLNILKHGKLATENEINNAINFINNNKVMLKEKLQKEYNKHIEEWKAFQNSEYYDKYIEEMNDTH